MKWNRLWVCDVWQRTFQLCNDHVGTFTCAFFGAFQQDESGTRHLRWPTAALSHWQSDSIYICVYVYIHTFMLSKHNEQYLGNNKDNWGPVHILYNKSITIIVTGLSFGYSSSVFFIYSVYSYFGLNPSRMQTSGWCREKRTIRLQTIYWLHWSSVVSYIISNEVLITMH